MGNPVGAELIRGTCPSGGMQDEVGGESGVPTPPHKMPRLSEFPRNQTFCSSLTRRVYFSSGFSTAMTIRSNSFACNGSSCFGEGGFDSTVSADTTSFLEESELEFVFHTKANLSNGI